MQKIMAIMIISCLAFGMSGCSQGVQANVSEALTKISDNGETSYTESIDAEGSVINITEPLIESSSYALRDALHNNWKAIKNKSKIEEEFTKLALGDKEINRDMIIEKGTDENSIEASGSPMTGSEGKSDNKATIKLDGKGNISSKIEVVVTKRNWEDSAYSAEVLKLH